ncbi:hypothetical protein [uncultured Methylobacterium sp.]|jgi:hypothetical protein|uniref:hypothetical protein n=1 Tax=uncultured Methylobacterium sp. TaxID=157278 RepID=UPI00260BA67F|nr:hypothetical protein [uncultured Methylobacterium sp.]
MPKRLELDAGAVGALADYYDWFKDAREGDLLVYWRGSLQFDRDPANFPELDVEGRERLAAIDALATRVMADAREGYLILNQKKLGPDDFEYRATRRRSSLERQLDEIKSRHEIPALA